MICIHHNKDNDGHTSGAVIRFKYPEAKLIGWDYSEEIPDFEQFRGEVVIMIDVTFPIAKIKELATIADHVTIIDHHISFFKQFKEEFMPEEKTDAQHITKSFNTFGKITLVYQLGIAACEIGWKYLFPNVPTPKAITLLGRYDTWRQEEGDWEGETMPFQYVMRLKCASAEEFPTYLFDKDFEQATIQSLVQTGRDIVAYQEKQDAIVAKTAFVKEVFGGLRGLVVNQGGFSSNTLKTVYNPEEHDIMIGFFFKKHQWLVSLRSDKPEIDCSQIAKERGGGGHKAAAGFETKSFDGIFI